MIAAAVAVGAAPALADGLDRFLQRVAEATERPLPAVAGELRLNCSDDVLCAARRLAQAWPQGVRLVGVDHPDTDSIRWAHTAPSVSVVEDVDGLRWLRLDGFGRTALREVEDALADRPLLLDLSGNHGGDFGRMLQVAGRLLGPVPAALTVGDRPVGLESDARPTEIAMVRVGPETSSAAEMLAALAVAYGGARLCGTGPTRGKDYLNRIVAVDHDWRLLARGPTIAVPGVSLAGGLRPEDC